MADEPMTPTTTPEGRLYDAGFTRQLEWWVSPDGKRLLNTDDAIDALDSGEVKPETIALPDTDIRALPDELVERVCTSQHATHSPPAWLVTQAQVIAEATVQKLKPLIRAEVRAALEAEARKQHREPSR